LETAASVAQLVLIESGKSDWARLASVLSSKPAQIANDSEHGEIAVGRNANIAIIDPKVQRKIARATASKSLNNPYVDRELPGAVVHTIYNGRFTVKNGALQNKEEIA
jgi:dihydroorotase